MRRSCFAGTPLSLLALAFTGAGTAQAQQVPNYHRPVWLPDGQHLVFMANQDEGDWELYMSRLDGTELQRLTRHPGWDGYASVAPDGTAIVFDRDDDAEGRRLVYQNLATGETRVLARSDGGHLGGGRWAPDGAGVFYQFEVDSRDIYYVPVEGGAAHAVTTTEADEGDFAVSPDGGSVVAVRKGEARNALVIIDLHSGAERTIHETTGSVYGVDWSPDGSSILYNDDVDGDFDIFLIAAEGGDPRQLTFNDETDHLPTWSPDGRRMAYTTESHDQERIVIQDVETDDRTDFRAQW